MRPSTPESFRRHLAGARRRVIPVALLALAPKCVLCALAYAGVGTALGIGGPELCGAAVDPWGWLWQLLGAALGAIGLIAWSRRHRAA